MRLIETVDGFDVEFLLKVCEFVSGSDEHFLHRHHQAFEFLGLFSTISSNQVLLNVKNTLALNLMSCVTCVRYYHCKTM